MNENLENDYTANQIACKIQWFRDNLHNIIEDIKECVRKSPTENIDVETLTTSDQIYDFAADVANERLLSFSESIMDEYWQLFDEIIVNR